MLYEKYQIIICHDLYYTWFKLLPDTTVFYTRLISVEGGGVFTGIRSDEASKLAAPFPKYFGTIFYYLQVCRCAILKLTFYGIEK